MDWSVQDLGALGEFVGSVAVLVTLIYLAYQFRQNSIIARAFCCGADPQVTIDGLERA